MRQRLWGTMPKTITRAVGAWDRGARNLPADVKTIQQLLQIVASEGNGAFNPGIDDGKIARAPGASATVRAFASAWKRGTGQRPVATTSYRLRRPSTSGL